MRFTLLGVLLLAPAASAMAQSRQASASGEDPDDIIVIANRYVGAVDAPQPPLVELDEADIASYGAGSIEELLDAISPQTSSARGRGSGHPVILVNGQRVSSFRELRSYPPEAIRKVEVLPEEVALRYGYPADQRVVNLILKQSFASRQVAGEYNVPTRGGFTESELEASLLNVNGPRRLSLEVKATDTSLLTEAERHVRQSPANIPDVVAEPDPAAYRSLVADSRELKAEGTWSRGLGEGGLDGLASFNGTFTRSDSRSLAGLDLVTLTAPDGTSARRSLPGALARTTRTETFEGGATLNKAFGNWQFTGTLDGSHGVTTTRIDRKADTSGLVNDAAAGLLAIDGPLPTLPDAGEDVARVTDNVLAAKLTLVGSPLRLPAGEITATLSAGFDYTDLESRDTRLNSKTSLDRSDFSAGVNLGIPLASRKNGVLEVLGDLSLNFSGGMHDLSDFGMLVNWSGGVTWSPVEDLTLQASYIVEEAAPDLTDLGNPQVLALNVPVFDFIQGETALVTVTTGGNPDLAKEKRRDIKLSANWDLPFLRRMNVIAEYFRNRSNDVTSRFPLLTPAIETAFPDRATRDALGNLVAIDRRPVTFDRTDSSRLRYGVNLSGVIGRKPQDEAREGGRPGHSGGGGPPMMIGGHASGQGRWGLGAYHTIRFDEKVRISAGGPTLDLLGGDALADGGVARHEVELEGRAYYRGFGMRLKGAYTAPVHVQGSGAPGSSDLRFGSTFVINLRLFVNFDRQEKLVKVSPFFKGLRLAFQFNNIFDSRQRVTDERGLVPLSYQVDYRDARGRFVGIDLRKMF